MQIFIFRTTFAMLVASTLAIVVPSDGHEPVEACAGLASLPTTHLVSRHCNFLKPRRIVIVAPPNRHDRVQEQDLFARSLAKHLGECRQFQVVVGTERICRDHLPMRKGTFDELQLLELSRKYNADCVLFCDLEQFAAYEPMQTEMSMLLVHISEAVALVSAKSTFDLQNSATRRSYLKYIQEEDPSAVLSIGAHTPTRFIDYAASEFSAGISSLW